jgi:CrcB protein
VQWLCLFVGGGLGAMARFAVGSWALTRAGEGFPWGTLAVNWLGCLAIGVAAALFAAWPHGPAVRLFLVTGVLGGFTTFSAFGLETFELLADGEGGRAFLYVAGSVVGGLLAVALGFFVGRAAA